MIFGIEGMTLLAASLGFIAFVVLYLLIFATVAWVKTVRSTAKMLKKTETPYTERDIWRSNN